MNTLTRPMYWSIRREVWENRALYVAPMAGIAAIMPAFLFYNARLPVTIGRLAGVDAARQREMITMPFNAVAGFTVTVAFVVGVLYCLDALYGERRDRSILFWKSLPVSDRTTVLAKAAIPLVVLPLFCFAIIVLAQLFMLLLGTLVLMTKGINPAALWSRLPIIQMTVALLYSMPALALWHAPIYAWLLLVSSWARRAAILWALAPLVVAGAFEAGAFRTRYVTAFVRYRIAGWFTQSFALAEPGADPGNPLSLLTPGKFLMTPGLWIGLVLAALFVAAAIRLRSSRQPI